VDVGVGVGVDVGVGKGVGVGVSVWVVGLAQEIVKAIRLTISISAINQTSVFFIYQTSKF